MEKPHIYGGNNKDQEILKKDIELERMNQDFAYAEMALSKTQKIILEMVLIELPSFLNKYGVEGSFSAERIHYIDMEKLTDEHKAFASQRSAVFNKTQNRIYLFSHDEEPLNKFLISLCHELLHTIQYESYSLQNIINISERRFGIGFLVKGDSKELDTYFSQINEAVTDRLMEKFIQYLGEKDGVRIEIPWAKNFTSPTYQKEKAYLDNLIQELYKISANKFKSGEEIFQLFINATFKGAVLPLAKLIEKRYGKGSFRKLGKLSQ